MKKIIGVLCIAVTLGLASLAFAQDSQRKDEGGVTVQGRSGDGSVDIRVREQKSQPSQPSAGPQGPSGVAGPQGVPGPQGPAGPSGGTTVLGMDPTIALIIGLGVLAVVVVAIVAASRGHETH